MNDFVLSGEFLTEFQLEDTKSYSTKAIVLLVDNARLGEESWKQKIVGKSMKDWTRDAVSEFECVYVVVKEKENPFEVIRPFIGDEDYTLVLFSDAPIVQESTIFDVLDYTITKRLDLCKLPRGFIINSKRFKEGKQEYVAEPNFIDKNQFLVVFDHKALSVASGVLKTRVIDKHLKNKVFIEDAASTYIEASVEIAPTARIGANNVLKGLTKIQAGAELKANNVVVDSVVGENASVVCSYLENAKVEENSQIGPFAKIVDKNKCEGEK